MRSQLAVASGAVFAVLALVVGACVGDDVTPAPAGGPEAGSSDDGGGADGTANTDAPGACAAPKALCDGKCVDTSSDPANCGECGKSCGGAKCFESTCAGEKVTSIATGDTFACALRASGSVWCWGSNSIAQLGARTVAGEELCDGVKCLPVPIRIEGFGKVASISVGYGAACAVTLTGDAYCWGRNARGELGNVPVEVCPSDACVTKPTKLPFGEPIAEVQLGLGSSCLRTLSQDVYCMGDNGLGLLGNGIADGGAPTAPTKVALPGTAKALSLSVGAGPKTHACARVGSSAYCWGANTNQQIRGAGGGTCPAGACEPTPYLIPGLNVVSQVIAGDGHTCVRDSAGVQCWGFGGYGVANGTSAPVTIPDIGAATEITGKDRHVCARLPDGQIRCFGASTDARLGFVQTDLTKPAGCSQSPCETTPQIVPALSATAISSFAHSVGIRFDGAVVAWGTSRYGMLGHSPNTAGDRTCPVGPGTTAPCNPSPQVIPMLP